MSPTDFIFQQGLDSKHTSAVTRKWLDSHHITTLPWAPNSPDMNILENVWDRLDQKVHSRNPLPRTVNELWVAIREEWYKLEPDYIASLYKSMPRRVVDLVDAKGHYTRY